MARKILIAALTVFLLAGCINSPLVSHTPASLTPVSSAVPTHTLPLTSGSNTANQCIGIENETSLQEVAKNGTVVVGQWDDRLYLLDLSTGSQYKLPFHSLMKTALTNGVRASPDRSKLAYVELIKNQTNDKLTWEIWVVDPRGNLLMNKTIDHQDYGQWNWLDNERLQISLPQTPTDGSIAILNSLTGEGYTLSNELPNFFTGSDLYPVSWLVEYSPDLEWVVYLGRIEESGTGPIVRDIKTKKNIWQESGPQAFKDNPEWSPASDEVAVLVNGQLSRIRRNGQITPLSQSDDGGKFGKFSWSPDGQHIAFWKGDNLMIYNLQANKVIDYCILSDKRPGKVPIWSPDSGQFIVGRVIERAGKLHSSSVLVDIQNNKAYEIEQTMEPADWMNSLP